MRRYQKPAEKPGLFSRFLDNIKEGMKRDKQMQVRALLKKKGRPFNKACCLEMVSEASKASQRVLKTEIIIEEAFL